MRAITLKNSHSTYIIHLQNGGGYKVGQRHNKGYARMIATGISEDDAYKEIGYLVVHENCKVKEVLK